MIGESLKFKFGSVEVDYAVPRCLNVSLESNVISLTPKQNDGKSAALWGTTQSNISSLVNGFVTKYKKELKLVGVGYKAAVAGGRIVMQLGYSHEIGIEIPEGVDVACPDPTTLIVSGSNKKEVGDFAAKVASYRRTEPYKGKGVCIVGKEIYRKEGKKK
jgi:large subunit ribosomal protein L6